MSLEWRMRKQNIEFGKSYSIIDKLAMINGIDDIFRFMFPSEEELHSSYLLKNIEKARDRIVKAIEEKQKIVIHIDCDNDGLNSGAIMYLYLKNFTDTIELIYNQRSVGHGVALTSEIPDADLLIIVDSSSNDVEKCKEISAQGIDVVIIDHHRIEQFNDYAIVVNPQQQDCNYPNKQSSGSLLTWKVCQTLDDYFHENYSDELVDLAAFGLYGDLMSMNEPENRFMVNYLLDNINSEGLRAILKVIGKEKAKLYSSDIGYSLTPFINAPTRMDKIEIPLELLTTDDPSRALELATEIQKLNQERKKIQKETIARLRPLIDNNDKCIVIVDRLGKGMNGLVANDLAGIYKRPVIVLGEYGDELQGSFRSFGGFDLLKFVSEFKLVLHSGGHSEAGGLSLKKRNLTRFKNQLNIKLKDVKLENIIEYDLELDAEEITEDLITKVQNFYRVSGKDFGEAKFLVRNLVVIQKNVIGNGDTLKLGVVSESDTWFVDESDYGNIKPSLILMKFKADDEFIDGVKVGNKIDVVGNLNLNLWVKHRPKYEVVKTKQLFMEDFRISNT